MLPQVEVPLDPRDEHAGVPVARGDAMRRVPRRGHATKGRRDANEPEVVAALKAAGALVWRIEQRGVFDLLVGFRERWYMIEVKTEHGELEDGQAVFALLADAARLPAWVVRTPQEALYAIGAAGPPEGVTQ